MCDDEFVAQPPGDTERQFKGLAFVGKALRFEL